MSKNIKLTSIVLIVLFSFFVLLKGLDKSNTYSPELSTTKIDFNFKAKDLFSDEEIFLDDLIKNDGMSLINIWASWCLPMDEFWFNIAMPGESTGWHDHKDRSLLSGVYYLKVPDNAGNINFREKNGDQFREWQIRSQTGKMILFHSNMEHSVSKNKSSENRISIAFNLYALPIDIDAFSDSYSSNKFYL